MVKFIFILFVMQILLCSDTWSQGTESFTVQIENGPTISVSLKALTELSNSEITLKDKDGDQHLFKGVRLSDHLRAHEAPNGPKLRGASLTKYVLAEARDGYKAIFSLPEIDPEFTQKTVLVAFQMDCKMLPVGDGPFRLVVPADKKHARWIRQLTSIRILDS